MSQTLLYLVCLSVLVIGWCGSQKTDTTTLTPLPRDTQNLNEVSPDTEERVGSVVESESDNDILTDDPTITTTLTNPGTYAQGDQSTIDTLTNEAKKVILFFYANRCPTCQALDKDIQLNANKIPTDVAIVKVDYDTQEQLKLKYDIKSQNTIVYLDNTQKALASKAGGIIALDEVIKNMP